MARLAATPDALSRNLAYLQIDLTDPDFRSHLQVNARETRREIESLLRAAVAEQTLRQDIDTPRLARTVEVAWIRRDFDAVLEPYLTGPGSTSAGRRGPGLTKRAPRRR